MITKQDLEKQLEILRQDFKKKWGDKDGWPVNNLDRRYWSFRADISKGLLIKEQIKKIEAGIEIKAGDMTDSQLEELFI